MIDEKKLIEDILEHKDKIKSCDKRVDEVYSLAHDHIIDIINIQPKTDWIPCEVEMPPQPRFSEESYLIKAECVTTPYTAYWNGEKWTDVLGDDIDDVVAWRPIPPYKKEGATDAEP